MISAALVYGSLCLILSGREDQVDWDAFSAADWASFADLAHKERVAPLVHWRLCQGRSWPCTMPAAVQAALTDAYFATAAHNTLLFRELDRILGVLGEIELPVVLLKGASLAASVYPHEALRPMGDLDLLVKRDRLDVAAQAVESLGYSAVELRPGFARQFDFHLLLASTRYKHVAVELHWDLIAHRSDSRSPSIGWFWNQVRAQDVSLVAGSGAGGRDALTLTPEAHLLYLAAHLLLQHSMTRASLLWLYDIHLLLQRYGDSLDYDLLLEQAKEFGWAAALRAAIYEARSRFDTPLPERLLEALEATAGGAERLGEPHQIHPLQAPRIEFTDIMRVLGWRSRLRYVRGLLFPSPAFIRGRHSRWLRWPWPLLYLFRWLRIPGGAFRIARQMATEGRPARAQAAEGRNAQEPRGGLG